MSNQVQPETYAAVCHKACQELSITFYTAETRDRSWQGNPKNRVVYGPLPVSDDEFREFLHVCTRVVAPESSETIWNRLRNLLVMEAATCVMQMER